jgi:hypothetical protein
MLILLVIIGIIFILVENNIKFARQRFLKKLGANPVFDYSPKNYPKFFQIIPNNIKNILKQLN